MLTYRSKGVFQLTLLAQCVLTTLAFWLWFLGFFPHLGLAGETLGRYVIYNEFLLLGLLASASTVRFNNGFSRPSFEIASEMAMRQTAAALFYLLLYLVALRDKAISRLFLFSFMPLLYVVLVASARYLPEYFARRVFTGTRAERILLVGTPASISHARQWCDAKKRLGFEPAGVLTDDTTADELESLPIFGRPEDLESILSTHVITQVLVSEFPSRKEVLQQYSRVCEHHGVRLLVVNDLNTHFGHPIAIFEDQGLFLIGLREEPLENPLNRLLKRLLDLVISLPMIVFGLPILAAIVWLCQKAQSPGPLLYKQERVGMQRRKFIALKFRTMHVKDSSDEVRHVTASDPRVFRAGHWLRKLNVDEFPQFINVWRGDMSLVGPRPHALKYDETYASVLGDYYVRSMVKPGLTGLAQVRGLRGEVRTQEDIRRRVETDIHYLENWSFLLDCWLILRTAFQVVLPSKSAV